MSPTYISPDPQDGDDDLFGDSDVETELMEEPKRLAATEEHQEDLIDWDDEDELQPLAPKLAEQGILEPIYEEDKLSATKDTEDELGLWSSGDDQAGTIDGEDATVDELGIWDDAYSQTYTSTRRRSSRKSDPSASQGFNMESPVVGLNMHRGNIAPVAAQDTELPHILISATGSEDHMPGVTGDDQEAPPTTRTQGPQTVSHRHTKVEFSIPHITISPDEDVIHGGQEIELLDEPQEGVDDEFADDADTAFEASLVPIDQMPAPGSSRVPGQPVMEVSSNDVLDGGDYGAGVPESSHRRFGGLLPPAHSGSEEETLDEGVGTRGLEEGSAVYGDDEGGGQEGDYDGYDGGQEEGNNEGDSEQEGGDGEVSGEQGGGDDGGQEGGDGEGNDEWQGGNDENDDEQQEDDENLQDHGIQGGRARGNGDERRDAGEAGQYVPDQGDDLGDDDDNEHESLSDEYEARDQDDPKGQDDEGQDGDDEQSDATARDDTPDPYLSTPFARRSQTPSPEPSHLTRELSPQSNVPHTQAHDSVQDVALAGPPSLSGITAHTSTAWLFPKASNRDAAFERKRETRPPVPELADDETSNSRHDALTPSDLPPGEGSDPDVWYVSTESAMSTQSADSNAENGGSYPSNPDSEVEEEVEEGIKVEGEESEPKLDGIEEELHNDRGDELDDWDPSADSRSPSPSASDRSQRSGSIPRAPLHGPHSLLPVVIAEPPSSPTIEISQPPPSRAQSRHATSGSPPIPGLNASPPLPSSPPSILSRLNSRNTPPEAPSLQTPPSSPPPRTSQPSPPSTNDTELNSHPPASQQLTPPHPESQPPPPSHPSWPPPSQAPRMVSPPPSPISPFTPLTPASPSHIHSPPPHPSHPSQPPSHPSSTPSFAPTAPTPIPAPVAQMTPSPVPAPLPAPPAPRRSTRLTRSARVDDNTLRELDDRGVAITAAVADRVRRGLPADIGGREGRAVLKAVVGGTRARSARSLSRERREREARDAMAGGSGVEEEEEEEDDDDEEESGMGERAWPGRRGMGRSVRGGIEAVWKGENTRGRKTATEAEGTGGGDAGKRKGRRGKGKKRTAPDRWQPGKRAKRTK